MSTPSLRSRGSSACRGDTGALRHLRGLSVLGMLVLVLAIGSVGCGSDDSAGPSEQRVEEVEADVQAGVDAGVCVPPACGTSLPFVPSDGYVGPDPAPGVGRSAAVDGGSVVVAEQGSWWAQGLVVNGGVVLGGAPSVRATLRDGTGAVITSVEAPVLVTPLRPGEPSPFRVEAAGVDAAAVADVAWEVVGGVVGADDVVGRSLELTVAWNRPAGGQAIEVSGYRDGGGPGSPLVTYVTVANTGELAVDAPRVIAAWVDGRGRILGLATADVLTPGTPDPLPSLAPAATADAVVVLAPPAADGLASIPPLLWGVGT